MLIDGGVSVKYAWLDRDGPYQRLCTAVKTGHFQIKWGHFLTRDFHQSLLRITWAILETCVVAEQIQQKDQNIKKSYSNAAPIKKCYNRDPTYFSILSGVFFTTFFDWGNHYASLITFLAFFLTFEAKWGENAWKTDTRTSLGQAIAANTIPIAFLKDLEVQIYLFE